MECGCDDMRGSGRESMGKAITKDSVFDSMRRVEAALKLRYMGIGFVWAWLYCTYATSAVFPYRSGQSTQAPTQKHPEPKQWFPPPKAALPLWKIFVSSGPRAVFDSATSRRRKIRARQLPPRGAMTHRS